MTHPLITQIIESGTTELPDGQSVKIHSHVTMAKGDLIQRCVEKARPEVAVEVGLAFGISTLFILDAMKAHGGGRLIGMDPMQHDAWQGAGLHNVERAGFSDRYTFIGEASRLALPRLLGEGQRVQFAFIDGNHAFDYVLTDFFYVDALLDIGGLVLFDDVGHASVRRACHFILSNRDYVLADQLLRPHRPSMRSQVKGAARSLLMPLFRDDSTPNAAVRQQQAEIATASVIALRKRGEDRRDNNHFVPF